MDDYDRYQEQTNRQKDLVLASNEYCMLMSRTSGQIKVYTGPIVLTLSAQESLVYFDEKEKRFIETTKFEAAKRLFTTCPEGWYIELKNPAKDNLHPEAARAVLSPELEIGRKINIPGPASFSLFPGQMAKVIKGHSLRSNQYLLAKVYDANVANKVAAETTVINANGEEISAKTANYHDGQILVIKGTEISYYIPPTGIEVCASDNKKYVRSAVTLERLEYSILKDENGEKRYVPGPAVVFPEPTEKFVETPKGGVVFRALELSPISGIYVKVISEYKDEDGTVHPAGEELFITGKEQMIYYPRPEHALIQYDGKYMHHAIAIPEGEGRYILDRLNGTIKTVVGPAMYLPDPRYEVVVQRKLSAKECFLMYPKNQEVLEYNKALNENSVMRTAVKTDSPTAALDSAYSTANQQATLAIFEANAKISRGTSYTKPRTITLDTKYQGVITIEVWPGYAISIIKKNGARRVVIGPQTVLLDYDETLESIKIPDGDKMVTTGFLPLNNIKIRDSINILSKDLIGCELVLNYSISFEEADKEKWFNQADYVQYLKDKMNSYLKEILNTYYIEELYPDIVDILKESVVENKEVAYFPENGMRIKDISLEDFRIYNETIAKSFVEGQKQSVLKSLELSYAKSSLDVVNELSEIELKKLQVANQLDQAKLDLDRALKEKKNEFERYIQENVAKRKEFEQEKELKEKQRDYEIKLEADKIQKIENDSIYERNCQNLEITERQRKSHADMVEQIMRGITPDLVAALTAKANSEMLETVASSMSPLAIAQDESIADVTNKLLRGTSLEGLLLNN